MGGLAEKELARLDAAPAGDREWGPVREAVQKGEAAARGGQGGRGRRGLAGLRDLYRGDAEAEAIIKVKKSV